jgi:serine/threonine protein kinase
MSQPTHIAHFQIVEPLPSSEKVRLYRALDQTSQRSVVIKTISTESQDPETREAITRFKNQVKVSAGLRHPGIVEVYEYGESSGFAFVASEFVEGCILQARLRVPIADVGSLAIQLFKALEFAHGKGVLHLNLRPGNLVLTSKGQLKLAEFGGPKPGPVDSAYRSPEQVNGGQVDQRTDIFSAGVILYEWLTSSTPFPGPAEKLPDQISHFHEPPASRAKQSVPPVFDRVCARALAKEASERYSSIPEVEDDFCAAYQEAFGRQPRDLVSNEMAVSAFLSSLRTDSKKNRSKPAIPRPQPAAPAAPATSSFPPETLRKVERELSPFLGPLARIVVKDAAPKAADLNALYDLAAESLGSADERRAFLGGRPGGRAVEVGPGHAVDSTETATFPGVVVSGRRAEMPAAQPLPPNEKRAKQDAPPPSEVKKPITDPKLAGGAPKSPPPSAGPVSVQANAQPAAGAKLPDPQPAEEEDLVARLEGLLGKQPANMAGHLGDDPPAVEQVIHAFIASVEALVRLYEAKGKTNGLTPQSIQFDRMGKASIQTPSATTLQRTMLVGAMGSPRYASPEILADKVSVGDATPAKADIYALGFIFYEILLGRKAFETVFPLKTDLDWLRWQADITKKTPTLKSLVEDHPIALSDLLQSMMEKDTSKRAGDPSAILVKLKAVAQQASRTVVAGPVGGNVGVPAAPSRSGSQVAASSPGKATTRKGGSQLVLVIAAIVVLLALLAFLGWRYFFQEKRSTIPEGHVRQASATLVIATADSSLQSRSRSTTHLPLKS